MGWRSGLGAEPRWRTYSASSDPLLDQGEGKGGEVTREKDRERVRDGE